MHRLLFLLACAARPGLAFHVPGSRVRPLGGARALRMSVLDGPGEVLGTITRKATDALTSPPAVELGTYALKVALQWAIPTAVIVIGSGVFVLIAVAAAAQRRRSSLMAALGALWRWVFGVGL